MRSWLVGSDVLSSRLQATTGGGGPTASQGSRASPPMNWVMLCGGAITGTPAQGGAVQPVDCPLLLTRVAGLTFN